MNRSTPTFDPVQPHWDLQRNFEDGTFIELGGRSISRHDIRLTNVVASELPHSMVAVVGRALAPRKRHAEVLAIRIGANAARYVELSLEMAAFVYINHDGVIRVERIRQDYRIFREAFERDEIGAERITSIRIIGGKIEYR